MYFAKSCREMVIKSMNSQTRSGSGLFHHNHEKGSLVITDLRMPYLNGIEFASKVCRITPDVKLLLITAPMRQIATMTRFYSSLGFSDMFRKPLLPRSLKVTVENFYWRSKVSKASRLCGSHYTKLSHHANHVIE